LRSTSANGPLNGRKGSLYEGGIREPLVVRWKGHIAAGTTSERVTGFEDWLPTLLELAGGTPPPVLDGISFALTLLGQPQPPRPFLYREHEGYGCQQAVRIGDWKGVRAKLKKNPDAPLELYNLKDDISESKDVAKEHPGLVAQLRQVMQTQHRPSKEFPLPGD